jgi:hypothetical protein
MDKSIEYRNMCEQAIPYLIEYFYENEKKLLPMFVYDYAMDNRIAINIWTPKTLKEKLGLNLNEIIVSVEQDRDAGMYIAEDSVKDRRIIPLWSQDQLQEMIDISVKRYYDTWISKLVQITNFALDERYGEVLPKTMEQLWLAFVMKEKYNKTWNGETWT